MQNKIKQLHVWQDKDRISRLIEDISESSDWYRGGRKIGKLRREYAKIEKTEPRVEDFFAQRINMAHQTYMDRLAIHKLKGPTNQQALKASEIVRIEQRIQMFEVAINQAEEIVSSVQQALSVCYNQEENEIDIEVTISAIKQMQEEVANKKNRIQVNNALVDVLKSANGFVGCSATIKNI
jgi:hypothetical protein